MNHEFDPSGPDAVLTDEERTLAARLARTAPQRGPSAELDARILDAARDAASTPKAVASPTRRLRRRRWPAVMGVAATLMLAVGLAWQLRPVDELHLEASEAPRASAPSGGRGGPSADDDSAAMADRATRTQERASAAAQSKAQVDAGDDRAQAASMPALPQAEPSASAPPETPRQLAPAPESFAADMEAPRAAAAAEPAHAPPPPPPPPSAPSAAPAPVAAHTELESTAPATAGTSTVDGGASGRVGDAVAPADRYEKKATAAPSELRRQANGAPASVSAEASRDDTGRERIEVTAARAQGFEDQPLDDEPPASADSPAVRDAWLQRVRDLLARGDRAAALDSLREYQRRHPDAPIPEDLRPLLPE